MLKQLPPNGLTEAGFKKLKLAYKNMYDRCYKPAHTGYANYGGRGIQVCSEWRASREAFIQWAMTNGHAEDLSLNRIDNNGNYEPANCKWSTMKEQGNNQRRNVLLTFNDKTQTQSQWANELGLGSHSVITRRLERGLPLERVLAPGRLNTWKHGTRTGYELHKCRCELCTASNTKRHQAQRAKRKNK